MLDLTGLSPDQLRARIESRRLHLAVLDFLAAHEPDLLAAAEALAVAPSAFAAARSELAK